MAENKKNSLKDKEGLFKALSLKARDIVYHQAACFSLIEALKKEGSSFDYEGFLNVVATGELLSDSYRTKVLNEKFGAYRALYQEYKKKKDGEKTANEQKAFSVAPDTLLQEAGFFYDIYIKARAMQTYYTLLEKKEAGKPLSKEEEKKIFEMKEVVFDLEEYLLSTKKKAVDKKIASVGEERILADSKKVQSFIGVTPQVLTQQETRQDMETFSTNEKLLQLITLETSLLNYRMREFAELVKAKDKASVYKDLREAVALSTFSIWDGIVVYLNEKHPDILQDHVLRERVATVMNLMSRSGENMQHAVAAYKFNEMARRYNEKNGSLSAKEKKEIEKKFKEEQIYYRRVAKKADRMAELLQNPASASLEEKGFLALNDPRIQALINDVYQVMSGEKESGAKFVQLEEIYAPKKDVPVENKTPLYDKETALKMMDVYLEKTKLARNVCLYDIAKLMGEDEETFDYHALFALIREDRFSTLANTKAYVKKNYGKLEKYTQEKLAEKIVQAVEAIDAYDAVSQVNFDLIDPKLVSEFTGAVTDHLINFDKAHDEQTIEELTRMSKIVEESLAKQKDFFFKAAHEKLMQSIARGDLNEVSDLLASGVAASKKDNAGDWPVVLAVQNKRYEIVEALVKKGGVSLKEEGVGEAVFDILLKTRHEKNHYNVRRLSFLIDLGLDPNVKGSEQMTPLMHMVKYGAEKDVQKLIEKGADLNAQNEKGETALMFAKTVPMFQLLLKNGADLNVKDQNGRQVLERIELKLVESDGMKDKTVREQRAVYNQLLDIGGAFLSEQISKDEGAQKPVEPVAQEKKVEPVREVTQPAEVVEPVAEEKAVEPVGEVTQPAEVVAPVAEVVAQEKKVESVREVTQPAEVVEPVRDDKEPAEVVAPVRDEKTAEPTEEKEPAEVVEPVRDEKEPVRTPDEEKNEPDNKTVEKIIKKNDNENHEEERGKVMDENLTQEFFEAVAQGNMDQVNALIEKGFDINHINEDGQTGLVMALANGHEEVALTLIEKGADLNMGLSDGTVLMLAAERGLTNAVSVLAQKGMDLNAKSSEELTALSFAIANGHEEVALKLIDMGADVNADLPENGTLLMLAAEQGLTNLLPVLIEKGADVNAKTSEGLTALAFAVGNGHMETVTALVSQGADVNVVYKGGQTLLDSLIELKEEDKEEHVLPMIEFLKANGAKTAEELNHKEEKDMSHSTASLFAAAAFTHNPDKVKELLDNGLDINEKDDQGETALQKTLKDAEAVALLIKKGADLKGTDKEGRSYLNLAMSQKAYQTAAVLVASGIDVTEKDEHGNTFYHQAAKIGSLEIIKALSKKALDLEAKEADGKTALMVALENGHFDLATYLVKEEGANVSAKDKDGLTVMDYFQKGLDHYDDPLGAKNKAASLYDHLVENKVLTKAGAIMSGADKSKKIELGISRLNDIQKACVSDLLKIASFSSLTEDMILKAAKEGLLSDKKAISDFLAKEVPSLPSGSEEEFKAFDYLHQIGKSQKWMEYGDELLKREAALEKQKKKEPLNEEEKALLDPHKEEEFKENEVEFLTQGNIADDYSKYVTKNESAVDKIREQVKDARGIVEKLGRDVANGGPDDFKQNLDKFDFDKVMDEAVWGKLKSVNGETCADMALSLVLTVGLTIPAELVTSYYKEKKALDKRNLEKRRANKDTYITDVLRGKNLTKQAVAADVADRIVTLIVTKDKCLEGLDLNDPVVLKNLTEEQKNAKELYDFAQKLPRNGNQIDWSMLTKKQREKYQKYAAQMILRPECYNFIANRYGTRPDKDDLDELLSLISGMDAQIIDIKQEKPKGIEEVKAPLLSDTQVEALARKTMKAIENAPKDSETGKMVASLPRYANGQIAYDLLDDKQKAAYQTSVALYLMGENGKAEISRLLQRAVSKEEILQAVNNVTSYIFVTMGAKALEKDKLFNKATEYITSGDVKSLQQMIQNGLDVNHQMVDGTSLVMIAVAGGQKEAMQALLSANANVNLLNEEGKTALDMAEELFEQTKDPSYQEIKEALMNMGAKTGAEIKEERERPAPIEEKERPTPTEEKKKVPEPTLRLSDIVKRMIPKGKTDDIMALISKGVDVNEVDENGDSLLSLAVKNGRPSLASALMSKMDPKLVEEVLSSPALMAEVEKMPPSNVKNWFMSVLKKYGKKDPVEEQNNLAIKLHQAAMSGDLKTIQSLLGNVNVNAPTAKTGQTPLMKAALKGHLAVAQTLIQNGADVKKADNNGNTPLIYAVAGQNKDCVRLMLLHSNDVNTPNKNGQTPAQWAALEAPNKEVFDLLVEKGAVVDANKLETEVKKRLQGAKEDKKQAYQEVLESVQKLNSDKKQEKVEERITPQEKVTPQPKPQPAPTVEQVTPQPKPKPAPTVEQVTPQPKPAPTVEQVTPQPKPAPTVEQVTPKPQPAPTVEQVTPQPKPAPTVEQVPPQPQPAPTVEQVPPQPQPAPTVEQVTPQPQPAPTVEQVTPQPQPAQPRPVVTAENKFVDPMMMKDPIAGDYQVLDESGLPMNGAGKVFVEEGKANAEARLINKVLDGKELSEKEAVKLGNIVSEIGLEKGQQTGSEEAKQVINNLVDGFKKGKDEKPAKPVSEEVRQAVADLYVYGALDDFVVSADKKQAMQELKENAQQKGTPAAQLSVLKEEVKIVASARELRRKQIELAEQKNQNAANKEMLRRRREQTQAAERDMARANAARDHLNGQNR